MSLLDGAVAMTIGLLVVFVVICIGGLLVALSVAAERIVRFLR